MPQVNIQDEGGAVASTAPEAATASPGSIVDMKAAEELAKEITKPKDEFAGWNPLSVAGVYGVGETENSHGPLTGLNELDNGHVARLYQDDYLEFFIPETRQVYTPIKDSQHVITQDDFIKFHLSLAVLSTGTGAAIDKKMGSQVPWKGFLAGMAGDFLLELFLSDLPSPSIGDRSHYMTFSDGSHVTLWTTPGLRGPKFSN